MASVDAVELSKYGKRVYINISRRGWAIVIMPDEIRIDNYHKEPHIHFKLKGMHIPIKYKDLEDVALVVELHLDRNRGIDKNTGREIIMIKIKLIRKISGKKLIQEFEEKYGSIDNLKKIFKEGKGDMKMELDLEDWEYFQKHPEEEMEQRVLLYNDPSFSMTDLKILDFIKNEKPESISELAKLMNKDVGNIAKKINNLKEKGFIELEEKKLNNTKTPTFNYDKIEIEI